MHEILTYLSEFRQNFVRISCIRRGDVTRDIAPIFESYVRILVIRRGSERVACGGVPSIGVCVAVCVAVCVVVCVAVCVACVLQCML